MLQNILPFYLLGASLGTSVHALRPNMRRQDGPVDPSTAKDCTYWATAVDKTFTCEYIEGLANLSHDDFVSWNPSVKSDCSGIKVGNAYCIEVNYGLPRPTTSTKPAAPPMTATTIKTTSRTTATTPTPTGPGKPSPTQNGLISSCTTFYKANQGDSCWAIANVIYPNTFTLDEFVSWNPAVGSDCMGLRVGYYYCIGVPGSPAVTLAPTSKPTATATATRCTASAPASTQPGALCGCKKWHKVSDGDVCYSIEQQYGISADDFLKWNPNVGSACGTLWLGYNVCVGM